MNKLYTSCKVLFQSAYGILRCLDEWVSQCNKLKMLIIDKNYDTITDEVGGVD